MIRSTRHSIKFLNKNKSENYISFLKECRRISSFIGDSIWNDGYESFDVKSGKLELPKYIDYKKFEIETNLSARCLSSICTQLSSIIRGVVCKKRKTSWVVDKLKGENKNSDFLEKKLANSKISKPNFEKINFEFSSKNADIEIGRHFDYFISLKSLGIFKKINIPIKKHEVDLKWEENGTLLKSFLFNEKYVEIRYEVNIPEKNPTENVVGADQGLKTVLTLSDGQTTPDCDIHGHTFDSILNKLSRQKKGSKSHGKTIEQRKNFINYSLNRIDFSNISELRFEKVKRLRFKSKSSRKMSHWTYTLIEDKLLRICEEQKVSVISQSSIYRSQRCSSCGLVRKANRKGKIYKCSHCGLEIDADFNASKNHIVDLPNIYWDFRSCRFNLGKGFFWTPKGFFDASGEELRVPLSKNKE